MKRRCQNCRHFSPSDIREEMGVCLDLTKRINERGEQAYDAIDGPVIKNASASSCLQHHPLNVAPEIKVRSTRVLIDHREWKNWRDDTPDGAIGNLNRLLAFHGVKIVLAGPDENEDFIELEARS